VLGKWSVLLLGVASLEASLLSSNDGGGISVFTLKWGKSVVLSVEIIPVEVSCVLLDLGGESDTLWSLGGWSHTVEVSLTSVVLNLLPKVH
jgi:hypothetical protein